METIAFYSYKGGVGRSLLLANAARFLTSLGKGVVALDLDFEAPGLHYKLVQAVVREGGMKGLGGAVPYLVATAQGATSPPPLEEHMVKVPVPPGSGGWLRLMPAGPAPERAYWAALKQLGEEVRFDDPSGEGLMPLLDLHARIEDELKPDYLLIDARTGVTELGGLATTILADTVVCLFVANQESLDGTLTVAEAVKAAPRLKGQRPVRIVPVLARTTSAPSGEGSFAVGVKRLLELSEGTDTGEKERKPFVLPHDDVHGAADRVIGGEKTASAFSPLYKAYLELFQKLFPSSAEGAQEALARLEAVASLKAELTRRDQRQYGLLTPWSPSSIDEGVSYESKGYSPPRSRYADLVFRDDSGRLLMVVEYVAEDAKDEAEEFWSVYTDVHCLVLLCRNQPGGVGREIYAREPYAEDARPWDEPPGLRLTDRRDPPLPKEFELLPNVGDWSVDSMLDASRRGHSEAVTWLVDKWRDCMEALLSAYDDVPWRPVRARRILDGLAATEDQSLAMHVLRCAAPNSPERWRTQSGGELDNVMAQGLFAPLFWRLPVEAVHRYLRPRRNLEEVLCMAGYQLLAEDLMGLHYDPDRIALAEGHALAVQQSGDEHMEESEAQSQWLRRLRENQLPHVLLSDEPPPAILWKELLREEPYWHGTLEEAKQKLGTKTKKLLDSKAGLRKRLRERLERRQLVTRGLLGHYDATGRLELYPNVIGAAAELLGLVPRYLKSVVFIHLSALALAHQARDLDGQSGYGFALPPPMSPYDRESPAHVSLAQCFAHRLIERLEDANLMAAFEKLSQHQPEAYRQWEAMREVPLERMRVLLMRVRAGAAAIGLPGVPQLE